MAKLDKLRNELDKLYKINDTFEKLSELQDE